MPRVDAPEPLTDQALLAAALKVAGTKAALAKRLKVSPQSLSDWARRRPIPRHARARLESLIAPAGTPEPTEHVDVEDLLDAELEAGLRISPDLPASVQRDISKRLKAIRDETAEEVRRVLAMARDRMTDAIKRREAEWRAARREHHESDR